MMVLNPAVMTRTTLVVVVVTLGIGHLPLVVSAHHNSCFLFITTTKHSPRNLKTSKFVKKVCTFGKGRVC